jgi:capsid protein
VRSNDREFTRQENAMMERFDSHAALHEYRLKVFGEVALAVALGRGRPGDAGTIAQARANNGSFDREAPRLVGAAQDRTAANMYMKDAAGIAMMSDSGLDQWGPMSEAFVQQAISASILGRLRGTHPVGFNRGQVEQTVFASASWVKGGGMKPVEAVSFGAFALPVRKVAVMGVLSLEALKLSGADVLLRAYLTNAVAERIDKTIASSDAEVSDESPAGLASNAIAISSSGSSVAQVANDLRSMIDAMAGRVSLNAATWILSPQSWAHFRLLKIGDADNTLAGFPVVSSSAADGTVMLLAASYLSVANNGPVTITSSQQATITVPSDNTSGQGVVSLWQQNLIALRAEAFVNWNLSGPTDSSGNPACVALTGATYA